MRAEIERRLGIDALDLYGLSEVMGPGVGAGMHRDQGWPDDLGGSFLSRDHRSPVRAAGCRRRGRRTRDHHADQGRHAADPLSHPRPDAPAARHRARHAAHGARQRAQRRHADHPRRQRISHRRSRRCWRRRSGSRRTTCSSCAGPSGSTSSMWWSRRARRPARWRRDDVAALERNGRASDQGVRRRHDARARGRAGHDRALAGQGQAGRRSAAERAEHGETERWRGGARRAARRRHSGCGDRCADCRRAGDGRRVRRGLRGATAVFWRVCDELVAHLPKQPERAAEHAAAAETIFRDARAARRAVPARPCEAPSMRRCTHGYSRFVRVEDLVFSRGRGDSRAWCRRASRSRPRRRCSSATRTAWRSTRGILLSHILGHERAGRASLPRHAAAAAGDRRASGAVRGRRRRRPRPRPGSSGAAAPSI